GWTVTEREAPDTRVPVRPRHICILFRRLSSFGRDVTRPYLRALEARHLPHVLIKGGSFNEREEVEAIRNLLGAIERPDDELVVFAALRGPVFALNDGALLEYRETVGSLHPFRKIPADLPTHLEEAAKALTLLRDLHRGRNRRPIADTIARLLAATRAHAGLAIWPTGEQALSNVMRIMDQARRYEARSGATSFRGFVDELDERAERDEASETPMVEEGTEGIRIMTVHRAKGLEFPVVILADITCNETQEGASRFVDAGKQLCALKLAGAAPRELLDNTEEEHRRDEEEAIRVLYVATTRARDLLVVPVIGDEEYDGWLARLNPVIYPDLDRRRSPLTRKPAGCPEFGEDAVRTRPAKAPGRMKSVAPGTHRARAGEHRTVWWDPSRLILDVTEAMGLRQDMLLRVDESKQASDRSKRDYKEWSERRAAMLAAGGTETVRVTTATELAIASPEVGLAEAGEIRIEETRRDPSRPHGTRFGTLVHSTISRVGLTAAREQIEETASLLGRILGADDKEIAAAAAAVHEALASPLMKRAASSAHLMRECSILAKLDDGVVVEGIADLAFAENDDSAVRWTIVDFKTDLELAPRLDEYRAQIGIYARGIRASTGCAASGVILWI
ncbi:MAG TPA: 3'-5' exonuclease, partial [Candidatus Binataceae bacterium]